MIISELDDIVDYDANRYEGWSFDRIIPSLRGIHPHAAEAWLDGGGVGAS